MKTILQFSFLITLLTLGSCNNKMAKEVMLDNSSVSSFSWDNATIYFMMTDRFNNGDSSNDFTHPTDTPAAPYRGFMGGDIKGITAKIKDGYFTDLGVNAIWMTPLVEQIKGSVDEGTGMSYPFHGYWARDWTAIDKRFGTKDDVKEMVSAAHESGIRVLFDVVANHIGPVTSFDPIWPDNWVKTGPRCQYKDFKSTTDCTLVENLPDIRTESSKEVGLPPFLINKWKAEGRYEIEVEELDIWFKETGYPRTAVNYILKWLVDFIKEYGVDGFRVDTVKHTEPEVWVDLWNAASKAYEDYKTANSDAKINDEPFYMVGEVYNYYVNNGRDFDFGDREVDFYSSGFHALINFDFKTDAHKTYEEIFSKNSSKLNGPLKGKSVVNYISSHDDGGPYDINRQDPLDSGTKLLLSPGAVQIYYGDETARSLTVEAKGDATLRSFMNWDELENNNVVNGHKTKDILAHWQKLGSFRNEHPSVGAGIHKMISATPYTFSRVWNDDKVIVRLAASGDQSIDVSSEYADGTELYEYYNKKSVIVKGGKIDIKSESGVVLLGIKRI